MRSSKKNRVGIKPTQWLSTAEKLERRKVKRKIGPSAIRRKTRRLSLQGGSNEPESTMSL